MKDYIITIGREFASEGRSLGRMIANQLGIDFYDAASLKEKARDLGLEDCMFDMFDEQPTRSFLFSVVMDPYAIDSAVNEGKVIEAQRKVICQAADNGSCVIVGRRADKILEDYDNVINIFVSKSLDDRVARVMNFKDNDLNEKACRRYVERRDRERASYYNYFGDGKWGKADNYNMCFNLSKMDKQTVVDIVCNYVRSLDK